MYPWKSMRFELGQTAHRPIPDPTPLALGSVHHKNMSIIDDHTRKHSDWKEATRVSFADSGLYAIPDGLAPLRVDCERGEAVLVEPNVWMAYPIGRDPHRHALQPSSIR